MRSVIYIPGDSGAMALGAGRVARAFEAELFRRGIEARIVRNGSRGLYFLEPMVEVETAQGRFAYGPVRAGDVVSLLDAGLLDGSDRHPLFLGETERFPSLRGRRG